MHRILRIILFFILDILKIDVHLASLTLFLSTSMHRILTIIVFYPGYPEYRCSFSFIEPVFINIDAQDTQDFCIRILYIMIIHVHLLIR